ncbi:kinesin-like protein KIN-UA isoform X2 [Tasmannia lanceolata]|uniref:kinesin-like protein KIN-UA isoform X2 n=1 Tax=Tasmannia lanceolata TaxID=3420 RepID=UPI004063328D
MASNSAFRTSLRSERQTSAKTNSSSVRSKPPYSKRSNLRPPSNNQDPVPGRVRVAVRLRPRNAEDLLYDSDFADCVELQPELKRLILRKNYWSSESFKFDEVLTDSASQRRVYDVVAKPVVESVLGGYNGTVMAYGQTGTGKTYTIGHLGKNDQSERGIMVRALEDIIAASSPESDTVAISYLELYLESVHDLLAPEKNNVPIAEDPKTGEVSLPGATIVKVRDLDHFLQLLLIGEANRHAANTRLNTESSRSHAILMVYIQRSAKGKENNDVSGHENGNTVHLHSSNGVPIVLKSKLLIVDLAGSERIDKSGSEGHTLDEAKSINLSLTSLGKCINALAENSPHIPTRDSKLTRLLRDSFGGSARTSLIITIGPSARHHAETASTIMFGQRAMKVINMVNLKEEFDYESLCRKLEHQVDSLTADMERQRQLRDKDIEQIEKKLKECQNSFGESEKSFSAKCQLLEEENIRLEMEIKNMIETLNLEKDRNNLLSGEVARMEQNKHQHESSTYQKVLADTTQMYEKKITELIKQIENEYARSDGAQEQLAEAKKVISDQQKSLQMKGQKEMDVLGMKLQEMNQLHEIAVNELQCLKTENRELLSGKAILYDELQALRQKLSDEEKKRMFLEDEIVKLKIIVFDNNIDLEVKRPNMKDDFDGVPLGLRSPMSLLKSNQSREIISGQRASIAKIFEEGIFFHVILWKFGLQKILASLRSKDLDVQIHAVKVVANLAAEDSNQEKIVEEGGLDALLMLLGSSDNATIHRVASGAIANLAMNEMNQGLIASKGGIRLLANIASKTDDPQTLRMVAGAIANLCGNEKIHVMLKEDGGTKALLGMLRSGHSEIIGQIARGMANFAKCETRGINRGHKKGRSVLIADGALTWMIANSSTTSASTRRHIELALCHLAQNEENAEDFISSGAVKELVHISHDSPKEDLRNLAKKTLNKNPLFLAEMQIARKNQQ